MLQVPQHMTTYGHLQVGWLKPECVLDASTDLPLYYLFSIAKLGTVATGYAAFVLLRLVLPHNRVEDLVYVSGTTVRRAVAARR